MQRTWRWPLLTSVLVPATGLLVAVLAQWTLEWELTSRAEKLLAAVVFIMVVWIFRPRRPAPQPSVERVTVDGLIASVRRGMNQRLDEPELKLKHSA